MSSEILASKDEENQQPIPTAWRQTLSNIVDAFRDGDFKLERNIAGVHRLSEEDARRIARNIHSYGAHLASLPDDAWQRSACQWMRGHWDALIDLYTVEEGASDLALSVRVYEATLGYEFWVDSVHVP